MNQTIEVLSGLRARTLRRVARKLRKPVIGAVPDWIRELPQEMGETKIDLQGVKKIFGERKPTLSDEIIRERRGEGAGKGRVRGAMDGDAAKALIERWAADGSGYDEEAWSEIRDGIESNRLSERKRFRGEDDRS